MCGICGWIDWEGRATVDVVQRMSDRLAHRGPDGDGVWRDPDGVAVLGHRRLKVLDVSERAHQPMEDAAGTVLSYNGEVYTFREIRSRLEVEGRPIASTGDAEVVLAALTRWGQQALDSFNGMFALAFWDTRKQSLLLARDRLGIKPLFWARTQRGLAFASELPAVLSHPEVPRDLRREDIARWLQLGYSTGDMTLVRGVRRLPPGCLLEASAESVQVRSWYDLPQRIAEGLEASSSQMAEVGLEETLRDAVRRRLVSDVPLGCFLSGGVDSSVVAAAAAAEGSRPETLTISFEGGEDEGPLARLTARSLGLAHRSESCTGEIALESLERWPEVGSDPIADPSLIPTRLISEAARKSWAVALSGDGGDELLGGYPRLKVMPKLAKVLGLPRAVRHGLLPFAPSTRWGWKLRAALGSSDSWQAYQCLQGVWPAREVGDLLGIATAPSPWPEDRLSPIRKMPADIKYRALDAVTFLPERVLAKVDRASMACSLEVRVPLLDHRVVEQLLVLPAKDAGAKRPLREILSKLGAPEPPRAKRGFEVPLGSWLRGPLKEEVSSLILGPEARDLGMNTQLLNEALDRHQRGGEALSERLLAIAVLVGWVRRWVA